MLKEVTIKRLRQEGIPVNLNLPPLENRIIRSVNEVARRINIMAIFHAISEDEDSIPFFAKHIEEQDLQSDLSQIEKDVLRRGVLSEQEEINFSWYQESIVALLWSIRVVDKMQSIRNEMKLSSLYKFMPPEVNLTEFISLAILRSEKEILEEAEFYYCCHWALRHPEVWGLFGKRKMKNFNFSVILERRKALEWVLEKTLDWDEIPLDT